MPTKNFEIGFPCLLKICIIFDNWKFWGSNIQLNIIFQWRFLHISKIIQIFFLRWQYIWSDHPLSASFLEEIRFFFHRRAIFEDFPPFCVSSIFDLTPSHLQILTARDIVYESRRLGRFSQEFFQNYSWNRQNCPGHVFRQQKGPVWSGSLLKSEILDLGPERKSQQSSYRKSEISKSVTTLLEIFEIFSFRIIDENN